MKAFPNPHYAGDSYQGMDLRDYFAAKAIAGFFSAGGWYGDGEYYSQVAKDAYKLADAMMKARQND